MKDSRKLELYESSVQDAPQEAARIAGFARKILGHEARALAEDFCGSFWLGYEWVKRHPLNQAWGLDLDAAVVNAGHHRHLESLDASQQRRARTMVIDVLRSRHPPVDLIYAGNFSYFIFKQRAVMLRYFRHCLSRLGKEGILILDHFGGPANAFPNRERRKVRCPSGEKFTYHWEQHGFSHVTHEAHFSIHFETEKEGLRKHVFRYDWRLWSLPELRDLLMEAGFGDVGVYWEFSNGFRRTEYGEDDTKSYVAYLIASKGVTGRHRSMRRL